MLKLLEDPDDKVYQIIQQKIIADADLFKVYLENYHALSVNELALERSEILLDEIFMIGFEKKLIAYINNKNRRLLDGVLLFEEYFDHDVDIDLLREETSKIIQSVWIELNDQLTGIEKVKLIGSVLFEKMNFKRYPVTEFKPEQLSFSNCINYHKYVAPSIAMLYCIVAQEIDVPLYPFAIPGLFILSYVDVELANAVFVDSNNGSVFYIHPFDKGEFINHQILEKYLNDNKIDKNIDDIGNLSYMEFLIFFFELRILALKHKKKEGFETYYSSRIIEILKSKL